eukprot:CAMPEP_0119540432 /NCGR_PEP_ID=MMETSP1344-20130328/52321_1 /TAXON_ID=236787 /ORGANISM="Florenciella parvula, Strain CCMP2471" /LENGTH=212 /DNA_ID=CAMNT_0007584179 /DNA_START=48 /DNA_END=684 /DNA_ORIENTATION=-
MRAADPADSASSLAPVLTNTSRSSGTDLKVEEDVRLAVNALVHHEGEDAHLRGTAVVELDGTLLELLLRGELVPAEVDEAVAEVTRELAEAGHVTHDEDLEGAAEENNLPETSSRELGEGREAGRHVSEGELLRVGDHAREADAVRGHDVAEDGKHRHAAVLELDATEAVEALLVDVLHKADRVPEAERLLRAELSLVRHGHRRLDGRTVAH